MNSRNDIESPEDAPAQFRGSISDYLAQVRTYWDASNRAYLRCLGTSFQSGLVMNARGRASPGTSNCYVAAQAGIIPGDRVLDAGCGVCGPSIDIARAIDGVTIDGITLSPIQAAEATRLIGKAGLAERIRVHVGDFHELPFEERVFDVAYFLESSGYSYSPRRLFGEIYRVLRPGGTIYIKDVFAKEGELSPLEREQLEDFNRIFLYLTATMSSTQEALQDSGFVDVTSRNLDELVSLERWRKAMVRYVGGLPVLSALGKITIFKFIEFPVLAGEMKAHKPG
jgi:ubiquinone/menaquinone biosynthesis C-methylase UbiE